mgnify:CR=1 FL=1
MPIANCSPLEGSLRWCEGKPVLPGLRRRLYYTAKSNIAEWPALPTDEFGRPTSAVLQGSFTMASDKVFHYIDVLVNDSGLTSEAQGEKPSQTQLNKLTAVHPAVDEAATMAAAYLNNNDVVVIVQDMDGKYRVIGNEKWQGNATVAQDNGQGATGKASTTINIEHTDLIPAPFYNGTIVTEDGTINEQGSGSGSGN